MSIYTKCFNMAPNNTKEEKAHILGWAQEKVTTTETVRHSSHSVTQPVTAAWNQLPNIIPPNKLSCGGFSKISKVTSKFSWHEVLKQPTVITVQLKKLCPKLLGNFTISIIQGHLQKVFNLPSCVAAKKPLLTIVMIKKRFAFPKKYQKWTKDEWSKMMFSDESSFKCFMARLRRMRKPQGSHQYDAQFTVKHVKHSEGVMVWASLSGTVGWGNIYFLPKTCTRNLDRYLKVLEDHLLTHFENHGCNLF